VNKSINYSSSFCVEGR